MRRTISVLLVEDDEDDHVLTRALLGEVDEADYALTWARTYDDGLRRLTAGGFDVCLLDYRLGERTGMELLAAALAAGVEVPIVFLTGQATRALDVEATVAGAADYLVKGRIHADSLGRTIRYAMERARALSTLRQLNRELAQTRDQAIAATRAKSGFLAAVGRACREPADAIEAGCDALADRLAGDPAAAAVLGDLRGAAARLRALLSEVLAADVRAVDPPPERRALAVGPLLDEVVAATRPLVGHGDNTLEVVRDGELGEITTDPAQLRRVLMVLLGNTCKFARRGRIELSATRRPARDGELGPAARPGDECLELAIRPSGLWMTPEQLELLFVGSPEAGAGDAPRGAGVESGIAASRRVCRELGGELFVETTGSRRPVLRVCVPASGA
jgi:signal transduction histidine kinase